MITLQELIAELSADIKGADDGVPYNTNCGRIRELLELLKPNPLPGPGSVKAAHDDEKAAPGAGIQYHYNPAHLCGTCGSCGEEMVHNVPRMGPAGGFVHKATGQFQCGPRQGIQVVAPDDSAANIAGAQTPEPNEALMFLRCTKHLSIPQLNANEYSGGECGACINARFEPLVRFVEHAAKEVGEYGRMGYNQPTESAIKAQQLLAQLEGNL